MAQVELAAGRTSDIYMQDYKVNAYKAKKLSLPNQQHRLEECCSDNEQFVIHRIVNQHVLISDRLLDV